MDDLVKRLRAWAENESQFNHTDRSRFLQSICADRIESLSAELSALHVVYREKLASWMLANSIATGHGETFDDLLGELRTHLERVKPARRDFGCAVRNGSVGANDPQDCNWPLCSCDGHADAVIAALQEAGLMKESPPLISDHTTAPTSRTCETCANVSNNPDQYPCSECSPVDLINWTPKVPASTTDKGEKP